jgi:hypothetical protein
MRAVVVATTGAAPQQQVQHEPEARHEEQVGFMMWSACAARAPYAHACSDRPPAQTRVVSALLVHRAHMHPQMARLPERSVALRARAVSALLVHRANMPPQSARLPERSVALRARVVSALLVHRAHMLPQMARLP